MEVTKPTPAKRFDVIFPPGERVSIYAGPYKKKPPYMRGVKMAEEIRLPCDVNVPTVDFSTPPADVLIDGLRQFVTLYRNDVAARRNGGDPYSGAPPLPGWYVGCMGGIGRTGMFLTALHQLSAWRPLFPVFGGLWWRKRVSVRQSIERVRATVHPHAVETNSQHAFLESLDLEPLARELFRRRTDSR